MQQNIFLKDKYLCSKKEKSLALVLSFYEYFLAHNLFLHLFFSMQVFVGELKAELDNLTPAQVSFSKKDINKKYIKYK